MKKFSLQKTWSIGWGSANCEIAKFVGFKNDAINYFKKLFPELNLNDEGYSKLGYVSYCVAEYLN